jgi:hypothetical protein
MRVSEFLRHPRNSVNLKAGDGIPPLTAVRLMMPASVPLAVSRPRPNRVANGLKSKPIVLLFIDH